MSSSTSTKLTATASENHGSSSPALMRMGVEADRVDATALFSTGVGAIKAEAPPTRSAAVHATNFGAMIAIYVSQVRPLRVLSAFGRARQILMHTKGVFAGGMH